MESNDCLWMGELLSKLFSKGYEFAVTIGGETFKSTTIAKASGGSPYLWRQRLSQTLGDKIGDPNQRATFKLEISFPKKVVYHLDYDSNTRQYKLRTTERDKVEPLASFYRLDYNSYMEIYQQAICGTP